MPGRFIKSQTYDVLTRMSGDISLGRHVILIEGFRDFFQSLESNAGIVSHIRHTTTSFNIISGHYSLKNNLSFDAI